MPSMKFRTVAVPVTAYERATYLRGVLARRGTEILPAHIRSSCGVEDGAVLGLGKLIEVALAVLDAETQMSFPAFKKKRAKKIGAKRYERRTLGDRRALGDG